MFTCRLFSFKRVIFTLWTFAKYSTYDFCQFLTISLVYLVLFKGEIPEDISRHAFGVNEKIEATLDEMYTCKRALDNESYIQFEFEVSRITFTRIVALRYCNIPIFLFQEDDS